LGDVSYGKGIAQEIIDLSDGSQLKMNVAEIFVGERKIKIDGVGVKPTVLIKGDAAQLKKVIKIARSICSYCRS
jgi:C-terminal processing protease CtpA/Prc